ncbi:hypothetical protein LINPERHAP1_LOCUS35307 [Linum perenne]
MQTVFLPASICDNIDRKICNFICSIEGARKIHNINWEMMRKPKSLDGLGLKAFLMKIVWGFVDPSLRAVGQGSNL